MTASATIRQNNRIARRLLAADGYLDLDLPLYALQELDRIPEPGAFLPSICYLRGVALKTLGRTAEAIPFLEDAARLIPVPLCRFAWKSLSECYAAEGDVSMAELARMVSQSEDLDEEADPIAEVGNIVQPPSTRPKLPAKHNTLDGE